eukprot:303274-Amphidinium_carterae.1
MEGLTEIAHDCLGGKAATDTCVHMCTHTHTHTFTPPPLRRLFTKRPLAQDSSRTNGASGV